jgi:antitoxin component YwqK of YwqJK toxin-antitoxin module
MEHNRQLNLINLYDEKGKRHGLWEEYYSNGQLSYKGNYVNGEEHGLWERYYFNGQLWYKGNYVNRKEHGYWEWYFDNGDLWCKGFFDMGNKVDYNPNEAIELTLDEISQRLGIPVERLKIKK